jgi:NitT/TauT family transport system substrate-binding protein
MMTPRQTGWWAGLALLLAAMLTSGAMAAQTNVRFALNSTFEGPSAPFLLSLDKGYFRAEGLNVTIEPGVDSLEAIKRVASGDYEIGFADINALITFRDANPAASVNAVFMLYNRPAFAVIGRKSRGISTPKDLEDKILGAPSSDGAFTQWPIFVKANGIDASKVKIENVSLPVREPMLAAGQVDAITGSSFTTYIDLKDKGVPVDDIAVLLMADYGVELYGAAIIVNSKFAAEHPESIRGFLRAFMRGLKDTLKQPSAAVESVLKRNSQAKKAVEIERLTMAIRENIATAEVKMNGYGNIDGQRFVRALDQIALTYKFKADKPKLNDIFDASFLPSAAERRIN